MSSPQTKFRQFAYTLAFILINLSCSDKNKEIQVRKVRILENYVNKVHNTSLFKGNENKFLFIQINGCEPCIKSALEIAIIVSQNGTKIVLLGE
jgi:hypothetical protein